MERQTGLETAHYGRRMREECGGSGLLDPINIGSGIVDRIGRPSWTRTGDRRRLERVTDEGRATKDGEEHADRGMQGGGMRGGQRSGQGRKDESMNESADNNAERSNDIQLNRTIRQKNTGLFKRRLTRTGTRTPVRRAIRTTRLPAKNRSRRDRESVITGRSQEGMCSGYL